MLIFTIKRGDTSPALQFALEPKSVSLAGASVRFQMMNRAGVTVIDEPALIVTATGDPTVAYVFAAGGTAIDGVYRAEFKVTYADGSIETFPNNAFIQVIIPADVPDLPGE